MRVALIEQILDLPEWDFLSIGEPMVGTGSVCIPAAERGMLVYGCEYVRRWAKVARMVFDEVGCEGVIWCEDSFVSHGQRGYVYEAILTSPPFPNSHPQGKSEMQQSLLSQKQTHAGNEFALANIWGCGSKPNREKWTHALYRILDNWSYNLAPDGPVFIHVKDFVRQGKRVDVGEWVADAFDRAELHLLGDYGVPLDYTSGFQEWKRYHQREIVEWIDDKTVDLECGHRMVYEKPPLKRPKKKVCTGKGCKKKAHVEVREERIIVGQLPAA
jgi:hypothetical protein